MATILMKLSEERAADQYDSWIRILTLNQDQVMRWYIVNKLLPRRGIVLDVGCGTGKLLIEAGRRGVKGIGLDMNESMLEVANKRVKKLNLGHWLKFEVGNALDMGLPEKSFDLVISTLMISELQPDELQEFVREAARMVKSGGKVVIGGEGHPQGIMGALITIVRRVSFWIVGKLTELGPHPFHNVPAAMRTAGLIPKHKVRFMGGILILYIAEAV